MGALFLPPMPIELLSNNYNKSGFISLYIEAQKASGPLDRIPRFVGCQVTVRVFSVSPCRGMMAS